MTKICHVVKIISNVPIINAFSVHGFVTAKKTVPTERTKMTALNAKDLLTFAEMIPANVFRLKMFVTDSKIVPTDQMKVKTVDQIIILYMEGSPVIDTNLSKLHQIWEWDLIKIFFTYRPFQVEFSDLSI